MSETDFKLLEDKPLGSDPTLLFSFYHKEVAAALEKVLNSETCVHTVGLFSRWGTGKSTIISLIEDSLKSQGASVFVFDAWKYQGDALRRIFLIKLVLFLRDQGVILPDNILDTLKHDHITGEVQSVLQEDKRSRWKKIGDWFRRNWFFFLGALFIGFGSWLWQNQPWFAIGILFQFSGVGIIFFKLLPPILLAAMKSSVDNFFHAAAPLTDFTLTLRREDRLNSPEQFEQLFSDILAKLGEKRVVIVFDNIDRVQGDIAIEMLSTIKTFLEPKQSSKLVFVIPCDSDAVTEQIRSFYKNQLDTTSFDPSEYLRKIFNVILWMPEFIDTDLQEYTKAQMKYTGNISALLLKDEYVSRVINYAFSGNPREIKQFINTLVASLVLASTTEVWEIIRADIPYLAKVLVLKQKYPAAYRRLMDKCYDSENILDTLIPEKEPGLKQFMANTSPVRVSDAEPFIYFKKPLKPDGVSAADAEVMRAALIGGDDESVEKVMASQKNNANSQLYITQLLSKYLVQPQILKQIFSTHLRVFSRLNFTPTNAPYFEVAVKAIDLALWQWFREFPTSAVFDILLSHKSARVIDWRASVISRYVLELDTDTMGQPDSSDLLVAILSSFARHKDILSEEQVGQIAKTIENRFYHYLEVIRIFDRPELQQAFITWNTGNKFLDQLDENNLLDRKGIITSLKGLIENNLQRQLLGRLTAILRKESDTNPDYTESKESLVLGIADILNVFNLTDFFEHTDQEGRNQFEQQVLRVFDGISGMSNRWFVLVLLEVISGSAEQNVRIEIENRTTSFFREATPDKMELLFGFLDSSSARFIDRYFDALKSRVRDDALLKFIYPLSNKDQKRDLILGLINEGNGAAVMPFLRDQKKEIPDRPKVLEALLRKAGTLPLNESGMFYAEFLPEILKSTDAVEVKDLAAEQVRSFFKSTTPAEQQNGSSLFDINFFSKDTKGEIAKDTIEWLRKSSNREMTSSDTFVLGSIAGAYSLLPATLKKDFAFMLLEALKPGQTRDTLARFLELLIQVHPTYQDHEAEYRGVLERLRTWTSDPNKELILTEFPKLKSVDAEENEKTYWHDFVSHSEHSDGDKIL